MYLHEVISDIHVHIFVV